jgi:GntR family transcriptional regulator, rspAB operon transcriptional repressor
VKKNHSADAIIDLIDSEHGPKRPDTQSAGAYRDIRRAILECRLAPGSMIDEKCLTTEFGYGRTPVREALLRLGSERLVQFLSGQAIQVTPIGLSDIRDLYEDRLHSERLAAFLAVKRMTTGQLHELEHNFDDVAAMIKAGRGADAIALDFRFHSLIYRGARNAILSEHLHQLFAHSYRLWRMTATADPARIWEIIRSHEPLVAALAGRHAEKLDGLIVEHISNAFERLLQIIKGEEFSAIGRLNVMSI